MSKSIKTVLLVDEGVAFGGALIVVARLAQALDPNEFRPIVVSAMDPDVVRHHLKEDIMFVQLKKPLTYVERSKVSEVLNRIRPRILFKAAIYSWSLIENIVNLPYLLKMIYMIIRYRVSVVHANNSFEPIIAAKLTFTKCLWHLHGAGQITSAWVLRLMKLPDHFISISNYERDNAVSSGLDPDKITVIHNPLDGNVGEVDDPALERLRAEMGVAPDRPIISIFGRLVGWKGQLEFLKAVKILVDKGYDLAALLVGDDGEGYGDYRNALESYVGEHLQSTQVIFTGFVKDTNPLYQISDIVVHASIEPEPFGLVITEAMHNGKPVVASKWGAGPELVEHEVSGIIADPRQPEDLAEKIAELLDDSQLRQSLAAKGREKVERDMNPAHYAVQVGRVYDSLCVGGGHSI